ncbi:hypothetical protein AgCh_027561 [Apium graveolens]
MKSQQNSFAIGHSPILEEPQPHSSRFSLRCGSSYKIAPTLSMNLRSPSQASSHFYDVDVEEYDDVYDDINVLVGMEEGQSHNHALPQSPPCVKWIEQNFGKEIQKMVSAKEKVIVHDTSNPEEKGRPNVSQMSVDAAKKWGAEVVIVTSNPEGRKDYVLDACKASGITAFGPIWD